jgi:hypothetical protein
MGSSDVGDIEREKREDFLQDEQECASTDTRSSDKHRTMETYLKHYKGFKQKKCA